jgi:hypothetical protein
MPRYARPRSFMQGHLERGYALRRQSSGVLRIRVIALVRRELKAHLRLEFGKRAPYWRRRRLQAITLYHQRFAKTEGYLSLPPILMARKLPPSRETLRQIREWNVTIIDPPNHSFPLTANGDAVGVV